MNVSDEGVYLGKFRTSKRSTLESRAADAIIIYLTVQRLH